MRCLEKMEDAVGLLCEKEDRRRRRETGLSALAMGSGLDNDGEGGSHCIEESLHGCNRGPLWNIHTHLAYYSCEITTLK